MSLHNKSWSLPDPTLPPCLPAYIYTALAAYLEGFRHQASSPSWLCRTLSRSRWENELSCTQLLKHLVLHPKQLCQSASIFALSLRDHIIIVARILRSVLIILMFLFLYPTAFLTVCHLSFTSSMPPQYTPFVSAVDFSAVFIKHPYPRAAPS
jgi:hypothetical protein